ncbi:DUF6884 domain-containing protein [Cupriavidus sp. SW-Y-13]|uniref:DUF6884 domain-containing protein n=1 Tax=Cupriavidus sp. SW-Y-13 TaxID=2653854 RepID=UPI001920A095|nr:DUF6884 domain-containing protein [Cupriavidus sp. SW-Y-13]
MQLAFFPHNTKVEFDPAAPALIVLACSGRKGTVRSPALQLYRGVMYQTYRAHFPCDAAAPAMVILSAKHGFVAPDDTLDPYDLQMTSARADEILAGLQQSVMQVAWPLRASKVLLAGGQTYRRVMRAAIGLVGASHLPIEEVSGGIGYQRSQLAKFLVEQGRPALADQCGFHPNGQPLYRRYGVYAVGDSVLFNDPGPGRSALKHAVLRELFHGPAGPTACADVDDTVAGRARVVSRWISLAGIRCRADEPAAHPPPLAATTASKMR